jgi:hypothetical protein
MVQMGWCFTRTFDLRLPAAFIGLVLFAAVGNPCFASAEAADAVESTEMLNRYADATRTQQDVLRGVQMEMDIDAKLPKLEKQGRFRALRKISRLGRITYKALGFSGDNTVKNEVITRYLAAESEARDKGSLAITPANYRFKYKGSVARDGRRVAMFQIAPRKKVLGLFKGELWLDAATGMPVRESGRFVKTPSVFLKKIEFVRNYELRDGVAFPTHIESTVDTRLVGRAELTINYSNFSKQESAEDDELSSVSADQ